ncbi:hypothetical protein [Streptomyces sp. NPDC088789]|uniref:hypothetical protein n=1 Tax=Streptomyces sp. NPDC088789 TaxID=3365899 RepID=UPI00382D798F
MVAENVLVLVRIDREEPHRAQETAQQLTAEKIPVEITPRLRQAMDEEPTWTGHPVSRYTHSEIREIFNEAQRIYDDIRHGRLRIHAHAADGDTVAAVGSYLDGSGRSVLLHGQDHLRSIHDTYDSAAMAFDAFEDRFGPEVRPGPAPATDAERQPRPSPPTSPTRGRTPSSTASSNATTPGRNGAPGPTTPLTPSTSPRSCASNAFTKPVPASQPGQLPDTPHPSPISPGTSP